MYSAFTDKIEHWIHSGESNHWYGKEGFGVSANAFRRNTRDFPIFERMQQGDNYIAATKIAEELFYEEAKLFGYEKDSEEYISLYNKMVPQYDKEKFENKWKKLDETKPSHTLVAHLGKDTYSHIHPIEPRGITVREAARLQSFHLILIGMYFLDLLLIPFHYLKCHSLELEFHFPLPATAIYILVQS